MFLNVNALARPFQIWIWDWAQICATLDSQLRCGEPDDEFNFLRRMIESNWAQLTAMPDDDASRSNRLDSAANSTSLPLNPDKN